MTSSLVAYKQITKVLNGIYEVNNYFHELMNAGYDSSEFPDVISCKIVHNITGIPDQLINFERDEMYKLLPEIHDFKLNNNIVGKQIKAVLSQLDDLANLMKTGGLAKLSIEVKAQYLKPNSTVLHNAGRWIGEFLNWTAVKQMGVERTDNITKVNLSERELNSLLAELVAIKLGRFDGEV